MSLNVSQISTGNLLNLLQSGFVTIKVRFKRDQGFSSRDYTYKAPASMGIAVGDEVIVDSPSSGMVVVEVMEVDEFGTIDYTAQHSYKWVVQKVDTTAYKIRSEVEKKAYKLLAQAKANLARDQYLGEINGLFGQSMNIIGDLGNQTASKCFLEARTLLAELNK